ncbi:MAG: TRAP transporter large permease subunit [Myxococcota bacterium]|nr:TRAP transporter large permease subunit [Myxococcota bacterium]
MQSPLPPNILDRTATFSILGLLLLVVFYGTAEKSHSRLQALGESMWPGYFQLRVDPQRPSCDLDVLEKQLGAATKAVEAEKAAAAAAAVNDGQEGAAAANKAAAAAIVPGADDDDFDDLFDDEEQELAGETLVIAQKSLLNECKESHRRYETASGRITQGVRVYRAFETSVASLVEWIDHFSHYILVILIIFSGLVTTIRQHHISLRPIGSALDQRVSSLSQLVASLLIVASFYSLRSIDTEQNIQDTAAMQWLWILGMSVVSLVHFRNLRVVGSGRSEEGTLGHALLTIPLYAYMALIAGFYFLIGESHPAGLAIYLGKLTEHRMLYLAVGLYVWVGMLLKQTNLASMIFDIIRPWKLAPELLAVVIVAGSAIPTAYSGASGIFVIAAGAVIYDELRKAGARRQLALAATAMSGSLGVVLRPCLLVVIVASLNKQVTTDELFGWGWRVYFLTAFLFMVACWFSKTSSWKLSEPSIAFSASLDKLKPLIPYFLVALGFLAFYELVLSTPVNEHTAPSILPVIFLVLLAIDKRKAKKLPASSGEAVLGFRRSCADATSETSTHIGALLMLMALSICLGGIVERSEIMNFFPQALGSAWSTMGLLVAVLVVIGMTMDPYGAVILVSASIADVAYRNGIDAVHFWMVVLVAFELGYLTPPVALNHLLTRQVVGEAELDDHSESTNQGFWARHERILLPMAVLGTALIIVAFVPLFFL